jgi:hypothetical protein
MNQDLRSALESMLDPEKNGWAFTERQRDCARVLLGLEPVELPKDVSVFDLLGLRSEWDRKVSDAPVGDCVLTTVRSGDDAVVMVDMKPSEGAWDGSSVIAWMPLPDPAPLPEGD